jgi:hypothetical protein
MPDQSHPGSHPGTPERRSQAIVAFLGTGMDDPPTAALCVQALAGARRSAAILHARHEPIENWLTAEIRFPGIKENAATLAALEISEQRQEIAQSYADRHPDHLAILHDLLAVLD